MDESRLDPRRAWAIALSLWLMVSFIVAYEILPASILPIVRDGLAVGPARVSWLVSVYLLAMAVFAIPAGLLLDRTDNRGVLGGGIIALVGTTIWSWQAAIDGLYLWLVSARFVAGVATVLIWTAAINIVGHVFDETNQGTAMAVVATSVPAGFAIGHLLSPTIAQRIGWTRTAPVYGLLTAGAFLLFWLVSYGDRFRVETAVPTRGDFAAVLANRGVIIVALLGFVGFSLNLFFNNWLPTFVAERFALPLVGGGVIGAAFPLIGVIARGTGGVLSDRFFGTRRRPIVLGSFLLIVPATAAVAVADELIVLLGAIVVAGFVTQLGLVLLIPFSRELVAENVAATAFAVLNTVGFLGAFSAPVITGVLIERLGYRAAFAYAGGLAIVGIVLAWAAPDR